MLAHKLKGAAGNLALREVAALADELVGVLHAGDDPAPALQRLDAAMRTALASIALFAQPEMSST